MLVNLVSRRASPLVVRFAHTAATYTSDFQRVKPDEIHAFVKRVMVAAGATEPHAETMAKVSTAADVRGIYSHGLNRLEMYVKECMEGSTDVGAEPVVVKDRKSVATVDGRNAHGHVVGEFCMNLAIRKARETGLGYVVARGSNHYGISGYYAMMAAKEGMVGISMTNTSPLVTPTRAIKPSLGTNPIACAAPEDEGQMFVLDMATSAVAVGKIEVAERKGVKVPEGWGTDSHGRVTTDPHAIREGGGLMPLAGTEAMGGYKGYGLAVMVEVLSSCLSGATMGPDVRAWRSTGAVTEKANLGQNFIAIDPAMCIEGFGHRVTDLFDKLRALKPVEGQTKVMVAGDPEADCEAEQLKNGVKVHDNMIKALRTLADRLKVKPLVI